MRKANIIMVLLAMLMLSTAASAQRRRTVVTKPEAPVEDPRITQMLANVQQVVFIDSIVADRTDFMRYIPLSPHCGQMAQQGRGASFTTEMGDHRLSTVEVNDSVTTIVASDYIGGQWTEGQPIGGIGSAAACNPFLMPDGVTLFFAQKGEKSIGGHDIFTTRYDIERGAFLKPENIGMPFASKADDIFFAIDEFNQLGYFVTDRRQPRGKVCIYIFIPEETRHAYRSEAYSDEQLRSLAAIGSIADTWGDRQMREEAMERLTTIQSNASDSDADVKDNGGNETESIKKQAANLKQELDKTRRYYANASRDEQEHLKHEIINAEQQLEQLLTQIRQRERNTPYQ